MSDWRPKLSRRKLATATGADLADEAIETAEALDYDGVSARVVLPEYLYLRPEARTPQSPLLGRGGPGDRVGPPAGLG